jgi:hypothetical protein
MLTARGITSNGVSDELAQLADAFAETRRASMSNADRLVALLEAKKGSYFCDRCLGELTGIAPQAQVNQLARPLEHAKDFRRMRTYCSSCGKDRLALGYFA